jgi:hypothetical protein
MGGDPPAVYAVLKPIVDECVTQLAEMSFEEVRLIVDSVSAGYRQLLLPVERPLTREYLRRVAEYCVAVELQAGYSPVSEVISPLPNDSEVLTACPELRSRFDDDGLLALTDDLLLFDGGIRYRKHFLHYHQFLRRGFSSNPNFDFLGTLARFRHETQDSNSFRIAIDHRRIINFDDYRHEMELDTWFGPKFDPNKLDDPNFVGLTVVARTYSNSLDSYPLEKTEFLWKTNEVESIKTLEIEELSAASNPHEHWHINRYVHAKRDMPNKTFRHFDGAAKVYAEDSYRTRMSQHMPNNIRPAHYVKLFRIDGAIDLEDWLSLVSMFYKGNEMVIEYFDPELFNNEIRPFRERMYAALNK